MPTNPFYELITPTPDLSETPIWKWGTITDDMQVILDADGGVPLADRPASLVEVAPGDRVYVQIYKRRAVILGKAVSFT